MQLVTLLQSCPLQWRNLNGTKDDEHRQTQRERGKGREITDSGRKREREKEWDEWTSLRWAQGQGKWSNDIDGVGVEVEEGRDVNERADVNAQCM